MYSGEQNDSKNSKSILLYLLLVAWDRQQKRLDAADLQLKEARNNYNEIWDEYKEVTTRTKILMEDPDVGFTSIEDLENNLKEMNYFKLIHPRSFAYPIFPRIEKSDTVD